VFSAILLRQLPRLLLTTQVIPQPRLRPGLFYLLDVMSREGSPVAEGDAMKTVAEYRKFADDCRGLAAKLRDPDDQRALLLMAAGWDKAATNRTAQLSATGEHGPIEPAKET
jgi:hypothetical protein